jgi:broad specificity phosphatase PhoE
MTRRLVLVRHGETAWSDERKHTGRSDIPLTDHGRAQAEQIADALAVFDVQRCFASPLARAWETAQLIGLEPERDDDLLEWDYGDFEGLTTAEIREHSPGWSVWTHEITGGESIEQVGARADRVIERVLGMDGTTALVAHSHLLRILVARWLELPPIEGRRFTLDNTTISLLGWERENRVVSRWNDPATWTGQADYQAISGSP